MMERGRVRPPTAEIPAAYPNTPEMETTPTFFLSFRVGVPLAGVGLSLAVAFLHPPLLGWAVLVGMALLTELRTTFRTGRSFMAKRQALLRWDGYWLWALRPVFRAIKMEERWLNSFCAWNNKRVAQAFGGKMAKRPIVLLPHCIQSIKCKAPVVQNPQACHRCGKCVVDPSVCAAERLGWDLRVSPRSRIAYMDAREKCPDIIIAVACSDRLVKGLTRLPEIPSYVIPLELPHGMCVDTVFDFSRLESAMEDLASPRTSNIHPVLTNVG